MRPPVHEQRGSERDELNHGQPGLDVPAERGIDHADHDGDRHERERGRDRHPLADPKIRLVVGIGADVQEAR